MLTSSELVSLVCGSFVIHTWISSNTWKQLMVIGHSFDSLLF